MRGNVHWGCYYVTTLDIEVDHQDHRFSCCESDFALGCVFITAVPITKLFAWGGGNNGGHVLRETMSQGLCGLVCLVCP